MKDRLWLSLPWRAFSYLIVALWLCSGSIAQEFAQNGSDIWAARPNLYFGVRPRLPNSLLTGLLWANAEEFATVSGNFRYTCEQHEGFAGYGWDEYDAQKGGRQVIHDVGNKIDLTIDFIKSPGSNGGSWGARIKGTPRKEAGSNVVTTLLFHAGLEGLGELHYGEGSDPKDTVSMTGETPALGDFKIDITSPSTNALPYKTHKSWDAKPLDRTLYASFQVPPEAVWQGKNLIFANIKPYIDELAKDYGAEDMPPPWQAFTISDDKQEGNFHVVQKVLVGAFEFDILFSSGAGPAMDSKSLTSRITEASKSFKSKFQGRFKPLAPYNKKQYTPFAESLFSNLMGGVGYFYGDSLVDRSADPAYDEENEGFWEETANARANAKVSVAPPVELFTSVPSRPFFPRGFLWDEGFHLIPILEWDLDITLDIVSSWFNLMDEDGWIAREQILGAEARSKVPPEFQVQYPHYANPPTLFMIIESLAKKVQSTKLSSAETFKITSKLTELYPLLTRQYSWFRRTQFGDIKSYDRSAPSMSQAYRWRGRTPQHILTSGLDDYPRAQPPHPGELHLDLMSWVGLMQRALIAVSTLLREDSDTTQFQNHHIALLKNIDALHWSDKDNCYCDATIDEYEEHALVCHKGYISLFPFMTGLLPTTHPHLMDVLALIGDKEHLWSEHGVRSLSKSSEFYGSDENYWRSPIWVNMNYLILVNLYKTATDKDAPSKVAEKARDLYNGLRRNLVGTVYESWKETGFAWEQYNPETGRGQRTQHFTGWTSLVVSIMKMPEIGKAGAAPEEGHTEL